MRLLWFVVHAAGCHRPVKLGIALQGKTRWVILVGQLWPCTAPKPHCLLSPGSAWQSHKPDAVQHTWQPEGQQLAHSVPGESGLTDTSSLHACYTKLCVPAELLDVISAGSCTSHQCSQLLHQSKTGNVLHCGGICES